MGRLLLPARSRFVLRPCPRSPSAAGAAARPAATASPHSARRRRSRAGRPALKNSWPWVVSSSLACRVAVSPIARTTYGGVSGAAVDLDGDADVADRAERGEPLAVDRDRLGPGLPQPVDEQGEVVVADQLGASPPGRVVDDDPDALPRDRAEAGDGLEPLQPGARRPDSVPVAAASRSPSPTLVARSRTIWSCRRETSLGRASDLLDQGRPAWRSTPALREVCTAAVATRTPKTATTTRAVRCERPLRAVRVGAPPARGAARRRGGSPRRAPAG